MQWWKTPLRQQGLIGVNNFPLKAIYRFFFFPERNPEKPSVHIYIEYIWHSLLYIYPY